MYGGQFLSFGHDHRYREALYYEDQDCSVYLSNAVRHGNIHGTRSYNRTV